MSDGYWQPAAPEATPVGNLVAILDRLASLEERVGIIESVLADSCIGSWSDDGSGEVPEPELPVVLPAGGVLDSATG